MRRLQSVNLEWHKQEPGLLALGRHCVSDSGQVAAALRDNLAPRTYCLMQYTGDSHAGVDSVCGATFTMETVRRVETLAEGGFALAVTDHDLYFMNTSSPIIDRTAYQPGRGMSFVDVALAAHDPRHTFAILAVDRTGENFTLSLAEGGDSLVALWSKVWVTPIVALAISCDGEYIALGREDGAVILVNRTKKVLWEHLPEDGPAVAALALDCKGSAISVTADGTVQKHAAIDGAIEWRLTLEQPAERVMPEIQSATFNVATDAHCGLIGVAGTYYSVPQNQKQAIEARCLLIDGSEGAPCWADNLPSPVTGISIPPSGEYAAVSCRNGDLSLLSVRFDDTSRVGAKGHRPNAFQQLYERAKEAAEHGDNETALSTINDALMVNPASTLAAALHDEATWQIRESVMSESTSVTFESLHMVEHALSLLPYDERLTIRRNALARLLSEKLCQEALELDMDGQEELAISLLTRSIDADETNLDVRIALKETQDRYVARLFGLSQSALAANKYEDALELLEKVHDFRPDETGLDERLRYCRAAIAYKTGMQFYNGKKYPQAAFQFKKALALQPDHTESARYLRFSEAFNRQGPPKPKNGDGASPPDTSDSAINARFSVLE